MCFLKLIWIYLIPYVCRPYTLKIPVKNANQFGIENDKYPSSTTEYVHIYKFWMRKNYILVIEYLIT